MALNSLSSAFSHKSTNVGMYFITILLLLSKKDVVGEMVLKRIYGEGEGESGRKLAMSGLHGRY